MKGITLAAALSICFSFSAAWALQPQNPEEQQAASPASKDNIIAKWAQFIPGADDTSPTTVSVRVVLSGAKASCDGIIKNVEPESIPTITARPNYDEEAFNITVCEARFTGGSDTEVALIDSTTLSWSSNIKRIVIMGDTGCRETEKK